MKTGSFTNGPHEPRAILADAMAMGSSLPDASRVGAIIAAAGASSRMGGVDKTLAPLGGEPLIARTVEVFERSPLVGSVVLMVAAGSVEPVRALAAERGWSKVAGVRAGGQRRQDTVRLGLEALAECDWVVVHDGARPLMGAALIADGLAAAAATGAAVPALPAVETVKRVAAGGRVVETLERGELVIAQTPQVFRRDLLERAHREVTGEVTDDAAMVERLGAEVRVFAGDPANMKVTTPLDLAVAEALLAARERAGS